MWSTVLGLVALAVLGWRLVDVFRRKQRQKAAATEFLFADVLEVVEEPVFEQRGADEYPRLSGTYRGFPVQIYPLVDTLATRRLPALWLMVTLQDKLPVKAHFDLMMRPAGPTTFSNFDHLPHTIEPPGRIPRTRGHPHRQCRRRASRFPAWATSGTLLRTTGKRAAHHPERGAHRVAVGGSGAGPLWSVSASRIRRSSDRGPSRAGHSGQANCHSQRHLWLED